MEPITKPEMLETLDESRILSLDVRGDLRAGRDPFQRIMHAKQALAVDGVLVVRAIFEPRPLYTVLAREGFDHWTEQLADDGWRIWCFQADRPNEPLREGRRSSGPALPNCGTPRPEPADVQLLDVRGLEPPEPMVRTLEALTGLPPGHTLVQINSRVPAMLLPELTARGFQFTVREDEPDLTRVFIRHSEDVPVLDVRLLPSPVKHSTIFKTFDALEPGGRFILLNDHDPVPLRYQFQAERPDAFTWQYLEEGPVAWRVEIGRTG